MRKSVSWRKHLLEDLQDPIEAAAYLNAAMEDENKEIFLLALRDVLDAYGSLTQASKKTNIKRVSLHKMLSKNGNPRLENIITLFNYLGLELKFKTPPPKKKAA